MSRSYIGAKVRLRHRVVRRDNVVFGAGVQMRVFDSTSGGLYLRCYKRGWCMHIRGVARSSVDVIGWGKKEGKE